MLITYRNLLALLSAIVCLCLYRTWKRLRAFRHKERLYNCQRPSRYPHLDPIWGYDLHRLRRRAAKEGRFYKLYDTHFKAFGKTFEENFFGRTVINTIEPENIQKVAIDAFEDWGKVDSRNSASSPVLGSGIFSQDGLAWKHSRELIKPTFARAEIANLVPLASYTDQLLELMPKDGRTIDIQPLLHRFFLDVSTDFLFGQPVNAMLPDPPLNTNEFIKAFNTSLAGIGRRRQAGRLHFLYMFDTKWKKAYTLVHRFIDAHVAQALDASTAKSSQDSSKLQKEQQQRQQMHSSPPPKRFRLLYEMALAIRDPLQLRYQVLNVFLAARDTTSILLGNTLFQLARNPRVWDQLREAVAGVATAPCDLSYEIIQSLTLFRNVLLEVIRLQGPAGRIWRSAVRDTVLPVGGGADGKSPVLVERGTMLAMNAWSLHHSEEYWGKDVNEFKPQRWATLVGDAPQLSLSSSTFVPFFRGPRTCPAQQQVLIQAAYVLVRLVQTFESIENRDPVEEYVEVTKILTESRNGVKVALLPAQRYVPSN